jgi:hypothetical protein
MKNRFCYWSVAVREKREPMQLCIDSARAAGVFQEFHILSDAPLEHCESYDALAGEEIEPLAMLAYLKAGIARLPFDYFVWLDPETVFTSCPMGLLDVLSKAPVHLPLIEDLRGVPADAFWCGVPAAAQVRVLESIGLRGPVWAADGAFWVVHHDVVDLFCDLAVDAWHRFQDAGFQPELSLLLGYAAQMLCANTARHRVEERFDLWAADYAGTRSDDGGVWEFAYPFSGARCIVDPAIVYLPAEGRSLEIPLVNDRLEPVAAAGGEI